MRRVEVCHFCLTKNPKSPWHQGIDVATATLQLMRYLLNDRILIIMVYEIISTYLGSMSSPTHSLSTKRGPLMWLVRTTWYLGGDPNCSQNRGKRQLPVGMQVPISKWRNKQASPRVRFHASSIWGYNLYTKPYDILTNSFGK